MSIDLQEEITDKLNFLRDDEIIRMAKLREIRHTRVTFAMDHHCNTRGERMNFNAFPHIRELYDNTAQVLVLQGSVQCFKSEFAVVDHLAMAFSGLSIFYVIPKHDLKVTYVQNRVDKCVQSVPRYKDIVGDAFFGSVSLKSFGRGVIKYVGSNVLADFKEFPADAIFVEEVDQCNSENVNYALDRIRASPYQFRRYLGNPSEPKRGINAFYLESNQNEWHVPCYACGKLIQTDWFKVVVKATKDKGGETVDYTLRDTEWERGCGRDTHMICPCGGRLIRDSKKGKWIPQNPSHPDTGYHISMLDSLINDISGMWARFTKATIDPVLLKQFYNSDLGLPFAASGNKVTTGLLERCVVPNYNFQVDEDCGYVKGDGHAGPCSMGIDVGGAFDVRISYRTNRGNRLAVFMGKVRHVQELYDLVERYNVQMAVIDAEPEATLSEEFQNTAGIPVWRCKYRHTEGTSAGMKLNDNDMVINIDRTDALDRSFVQLKRKKNLLPANYSAILGGEYESEMCMPIREAVDDPKRGSRRFIWTKGKDHQRHCDTYDMLAADLMDSDEIDAVIG